jgi:hypothetical protein
VTPEGPPVMKNPRPASRGFKNHSLTKATSSVAIVVGVGGPLGLT